MNRFEQALSDCMLPTAALLERTSKPFHRAILLNWWRHVHLEGSTQFDKIVAPDMMVEHPVYRVAWGAQPTVLEGKEAVLAFYRSVADAVLWHSEDRIAVADWGVADELTFHHLARGSALQALGYDAPDADTLYHARSRQVFLWPYDEHARLVGEHLYEDPTSLELHEVDPAEAITPGRVQQIHREGLARLEAEYGPRYWVY